MRLTGFLENMLRLCLVFIIFLMGCVQQKELAPVVELEWHSKNRGEATHIVRRGETLYAIAFHYEKDYRQLAAYNHLQRPYTLRANQVLRIKPSHYPSSFAPVINAKQVIKHVMLNKQKSAPKTIIKKTYKPKIKPILLQKPAKGLIWPAKGRIATNFFPEKGKKGIDIAGNKGDVIHAADGGIVAYSGSGLLGYGNLIIIKHDNQLLTAYGNNLRNRVVEGQRVVAGQVIAEMGIINRTFWGVHFEIRKAGQPVNPLNYLRRG